MTKIGILSVFCLALAAVLLAGCVVVPARPWYRPVYVYR